MEIVKENYHPSFFKGTDMKSVFEFDLPTEDQAHYDALNGSKYKEILLKFIEEKEFQAREYAGQVESAIAGDDINRLKTLAATFEVLLYRK